jgi:23S rRNA (guanosine2251-2'-O)-methyltransferase
VRRPSEDGLGGDQVEGRHAVHELLLAGNRRVREVILEAGLDDAPILEQIIDLADEAKVPLKELSGSRFDAIARTGAPQGVVALAAPIPETSLARMVSSRPNPFLLVVDGVTDPGNLGALLRTAECAGVDGVVLARHRAARITPTVTKAAAGAIEHLPMCRVPGIPNAITDLIERGVWTVGLDVVADTDVGDLAVAADPLALVVGDEGRGLSRLVAERCDVVATIPMYGRLNSLNVAAATAIACFAIARRRKATESPS